jgi:uncharacterized protein YdhG (YjbR/CyaY superfamily)
MISAKPSFNTIDEYIALFPADIRKKLRELRTTIKAAAPEAEEKISYMMPAFALNGPLVYFAVFKDHFSFFPTSNGIHVFKKDLAAYDVSKGTIRFPLDKPLPLALINKIVKFRVAENLKNAEMKSSKKKHL